MSKPIEPEDLDNTNVEEFISTILVDLKQDLKFFSQPNGLHLLPQGCRNLGTSLAEPVLRAFIPIGTVMGPRTLEPMYTP